MKKLICKYVLVVFVLTGFVRKVSAQEDSVTLSQVIRSVIQNHPVVKEAEEALNIAEARIGQAKSAYLPNVDASGSYTRVGPVPPPFVLGDKKIQLVPEDNYGASVNYNQVIYDFGKNGKNVKLQTESRLLSENNVELTRQRLASRTISTYYTLLYIQEALNIKNQELQTLNEHLNFVQKKFSTGSATRFEVLSTQVKISNTESQKLDLENMQKVQVSVLSSLTGIPVQNVKKDLSSAEVNAPSDTSAISYALEHRIEMVSSKEQEKIADLQYQFTKAQNNPTVNLFATGGAKNGYIPDIAKIRLNYTAGIGVRIPIFDGNRMKYNLQQSKSAVNNSAFETENTKRNISDEVISSQADCVTAKEKIDRAQLQLTQAEEAFSLANVSFNTGAMTNLDLLDAETAMSETRLLLLKSKIDYLVSLYRLKMSLGDKLY